MANTGVVPAEPRTGVSIAYETFGDPTHPPVLLVMGLGGQLLGWGEGFCQALVERSHFVIRYDNRDVGLSTHLQDAPRPDFEAISSGDLSSVSYTLSDMARDAVRLLDHLSLDAAHVVGASLGGMVAQTLALEHSTRVRTLTSIMSTTGDPAVGESSDDARALLFGPPSTDRAAAIEGAVTAHRVIGSPGYPTDEDELRAHAAAAFDRAFDPVGVARQLAAIFASGDRTPRLGRVRVPTLVIHGDQDRLVGVSGGQATAAAIPAAELVVIEGMGHDLPTALWPEIVDHISTLVQRVEDRTLRST